MPKRAFELDVPKEVKDKQFEQEYLNTAQTFLKEQTVLRLYRDGKISTGTGAKMLNMDIHDFMRFLGPHKVSIFRGSAKELEEDARSAKSAAKPPSKKRKSSR